MWKKCSSRGFLVCRVSPSQLCDSSYLSSSVSSERASSLAKNQGSARKIIDFHTKSPSLFLVSFFFLLLCIDFPHTFFPSLLHTQFFSLTFRPPHCSLPHRHRLPMCILSQYNEGSDESLLYPLRHFDLHLQLWIRGLSFADCGDIHLCNHQFAAQVAIPRAGIVHLSHGLLADW